MTEHPLIVFLRARLDKREALARAARDGWQEWVITVTADCYVDPEAEYIRQNGPAHVLREVEADRKLLDLHRREPFHDAPEVGFCAECQKSAGVYPCATVRLLAEPYADRPDYPKDQP